MFENEVQPINRLLEIIKLSKTHVIKKEKNAIQIISRPEIFEKKISGAYLYYKVMGSEGLEILSFKAGGLGAFHLTTPVQPSTAGYRPARYIPALITLFSSEGKISNIWKANALKIASLD